MRSRWLWPAAFGAALLVAVAASGFVLYRRAASVLEEELTDRLLSVGRLAAAAPDQRHLAALRDAGRLENAFVLDAHDRSIADARDGIAPGTAYTLLDVDPDAVDAARGGREVVVTLGEFEGIRLEAAHVPAGEGRVAVVVASPAFIAPLHALRRLPWLSLALGLLSAFAFALALASARRRLDEAATASLRIERLATAGRLAAEVAHELRNPLAILRASVQLATEAVTSGADPRPLLADTLDEVLRLDALVSEFLSLSREVALVRAPCDLSAVAERAAGLVEIGTKRPVTRAFAPAPVVVSADERRVRQALLALLLNALESAPAAKAEVRTGLDSSGAWVEVSDDGPGMDAPTRARAGDPFFTTKPAGTGLGLSVVHQIAAAHGARLELTSAPGSGTRARLVFPMSVDVGAHAPM